MKYCLIYWVIESCMILMNLTVYLFIPHIVQWLDVVCVCVCT